MGFLATQIRRKLWVFPYRNSRAAEFNNKIKAALSGHRSSPLATSNNQFLRYSIAERGHFGIYFFSKVTSHYTDL